MSEVDFEKYSEQSVHFFSRKIPDLLAKALDHFGPAATLADIGCGDGHLVWTLLDSGRITPATHVYGVDISPVRLHRFCSLTGFQGILAHEGEISELDAGCIDLTLSTMVIEHVPDDLTYARELARITRHGGWLYLSTVIRKRGAWYFRKAPDGRRVLDPTHLREYPSADAVLKVLKAAGFAVKEQRVSRLFFPIVHPIVRWLHARWPIANVHTVFLKRHINWLEVFALPIPRYRSIEILAQRSDTSASPSSDCSALV